MATKHLTKSDIQLNLNILRTKKKKKGTVKRTRIMNA